eukprot:scaffold3793_cov122-Isochrysis_galbana.AAC.3
MWEGGGRGALVSRATRTNAKKKPFIHYFLLGLGLVCARTLSRATPDPGCVFFYLLLGCKRTRAQPSATLPGPGKIFTTLHLVGAAGLPRGPTIWVFPYRPWPRPAWSIGCRMCRVSSERRMCPSRPADA